MQLLRKKDLHPKVGVPKSTIADWVEDFNIYIPKTKQGSVTYYKPETVDVLLFIKKCRDQNYQKPQIMQMLADKGFPITVEEAIDDVKKALEVDSPRDTLITVMQMTGQAIAKIADQDERINEHTETLKALQDKQDGQNGRLTELEKRTEEIELLKQEIQTLRSELAASSQKKGLFARLFGK
jgi:DNA-binding transcriptional MerR regulator